MEGIQELEFYSKFARPLIFALPDAKDRVLAAAWVKKIKQDEQANEKLKTDYIKLLLFALQRKKLVGIFTDDPTNYEILEEFPDEYDLNEMAKDLIMAEQKERRNNIRRQLQGQIGDFPPYTTDVSSDLREYVAAQDIPGFGVHCYYAISKDPITSWQKADKGIFPKVAKSAVITASPLPVGKQAGICISCHGPEGEPCKPVEPITDSGKKKKKKIKKSFGDSPPVKPLATKIEPEEERKPPTWSSTLMEVLERPTATTGAVPKLRSEKQILQAQKRFERVAELDSDLEDDYNEIERALRDFERGEIIEQGKKRRKVNILDGLDDDDYDKDDQDEVESKTRLNYDFEKFYDLSETEYEQELKQDSLLIKHFRDTINTRNMQKEINRATENVQGVLPAQAGIPLTTPKPSINPKRINSPNIYTAEKSLTKDVLKQSDTISPKSKCPLECSGKDVEMDKLFQEAMTLSQLIEDELEPDYSDIKTDPSIKEDTSQDKQEDITIPEPQPPQPQPMRPITRGSPVAHKVFAEVVPPLREQLQAKNREDDREQQLRQGPESSFRSTPQNVMRSLSRTEKEQEYIDYLFRHDRKTAEMLKRVANVVSDIDQDEPDPDIFPPSPPFPCPSKVPALEDETFDELIPPSPPASPATPTNQPTQPECKAACGQKELSQTQKTIIPSSRIPKPGVSSRVPLQTKLPHPSTTTPGAKPVSIVQRDSAPGRDTSQVRTDTSTTSSVQRQFSQRNKIPQPQFSPRENQQFSTSPQRLPEFSMKECPLSSMAKAQSSIEAKYERTASPTVPSPFPQDETMFDFAKGYIPPTYQSPPGIDRELPPQFVSPGRTSPIANYAAQGGLSPQQTVRSMGELPPQLVSPDRTSPKTLANYAAQGRLSQQQAARSMGQDFSLYQTEPPQPTETRRESKRICPNVKLRIADTNVDDFINDVMSRHPDLPPSDFSPPSQRPISTPGWQSPERSFPTFNQSPASGQMLDRIRPPEFYSPPEVPVMVERGGNNIFDSSMNQYLTPMSPDAAGASRRPESTGMPIRNGSPFHQDTFNGSRGIPTGSRIQTNSPPQRICPNSQQSSSYRKY